MLQALQYTIEMLAKDMLTRTLQNATNKFIAPCRQLLHFTGCIKTSAGP